MNICRCVHRRAALEIGDDFRVPSACERFTSGLNNKLRKLVSEERKVHLRESCELNRSVVQ